MRFIADLSIVLHYALCECAGNKLRDFRLPLVREFLQIVALWENVLWEIFDVIFFCEFYILGMILIIGWLFQDIGKYIFIVMLITDVANKLMYEFAFEFGMTNNKI